MSRTNVPTNERTGTVSCDFIGCPLIATAEPLAGHRFCPTHRDVFANLQSDKGATSLLKPKPKRKPPASRKKAAKRPAH